jgi:hypothetical protein
VTRPRWRALENKVATWVVNKWPIGMALGRRDGRDGAREQSARRSGTTSTERGEASHAARHSPETGAEPVAEGKVVGGGSHASNGWLDASQTGVAIVGQDDDKALKAHVPFHATSSTARSPN